MANSGTITNSPFTYQGVPKLTNSQYGLGQASVGMQASGDGMTYTFTGTGIDIFWVKTPSGGSFSYSVDGAAATNVSTTGTPVVDGNRTMIRGLSSASHTIALAFVTGAVDVVTGFMVYDGDESAGIRLWNGGHGSWKSNNYANINPNWMDTIPVAQPSLVAVALTLNDYSTSVTAATFKTNIQTIMTNVKAKCTTPPTLLLIAEPGRGDTTSPIEPYPNYVDTLYEIAASDPTVMVLDLYRRLGITPVTGITNASSGGLINVDKVHFSDFGAQWVADMMTALASPS
ncbi:hypothetical protein [Arthrobacter sp. LjRoot14]|uniref:hypothetical protein n=1 Tax=Arthrobacter sp. LjRoot14 TaxID=3342265 RepID=UPI003ECDA582